MSRLERYLPSEPDLTARSYSERASAMAPTPDAPGRGLHLTLSHYGELMRLNRRLLVLLTLLAALLGGLHAVYKLNFSPVYRASATVTLQPTDAELEFTRVYVRSSAFDSANVVTRSHIEYLSSHEIAARAYATLSQGGGAQRQLAVPETAPEWLVQAKEAKAWLTSTLKWMNSGTPVNAPAEGSPEDTIAEIRDAISLAMVDSSFVMQISVDWEDPQVAAELANILAAVYEKRSREQIAAATAELTRFLDEQKAEAEARLWSLLAERNVLRESSGIVDLAAQRSELLARLFRETERRDDDLRERTSVRAMLDAFLPEEPASRFDGVSLNMKEELLRAQMREVDLNQAIAQRENTIAGLQQSIATLSPREADFEAINSEITRTRNQLDDIDARLLNVRMNQASGSETLRVIDTARPPIFPEEPKVISQTLFSGLSGLLLAMLLVLTRDFTNSTLRTTAELSDLNGLRALGPVKLDGHVPAEAQARPFLSWYGFDTDERVMVLDLSEEDRAAAIAFRMLDHYPYTDNIFAGLAAHVRRPGYLDGCAIVFLTLGRGENTPETVLETVQQIHKWNPGASIAIAYVDGKWQGTGPTT